VLDLLGANPEDGGMTPEEKAREILAARLA
jgi:hypothetical protein